MITLRKLRPGFPHRFPWRIFLRIILVQAFLILAAVAVSALATRYFFKRQFAIQAGNQIQDTLKALSRDFPASPSQQWCSTRAQDTALRLTVIGRNGTVYCDSHHNPSLLENHANRPEVVQAFQSGSGLSERFSSTQREDTLYGAVLVPGHDLVLRASISLSRLNNTLRVFDTSLMAFLLLIALVQILFAVLSGRQLVFPLGRMILKASGEPGAAEDLTDAAVEQPGEWTELESALDRIRSDLQQKTDTLSREREELATLMTAISDGILAVNIQGKPLFFNSRFALLFFDKDHRGSQPHLGEIFRGPEVLRAFQAALHEGTPQEVSAPLYIRGESVPRHFAISIAPLRREIGPVYGAVGVFHDVTEMKRAESIRIEFVANVSHELRTPLTAIKGYADTLREDLEQRRLDSAPRFLEIITKNVNRLMSLIGDLLDLSSLESGESGENGGSFERDAVDTREITERVLAQLERRRAEKNHQISTVFSASSVLAAPSRLEQVLTNLLENAIKYVPAGGRIEVIWDATPDSVLLRIKDNGPGIPPEHQPRLFERFYRVDQARSREMGGTGLGLAIVKHIMQRHNGAIWVESNPRDGTSFVCRFPTT